MDIGDVAVNKQDPDTIHLPASMGTGGTADGRLCLMAEVQSAVDQERGRQLRMVEEYTLKQGIRVCLAGKVTWELR